MERRTFLGSLALLAAPRAAMAQPAERRYRVGFLNASTPGGQVEAVLREGLRALGYVEGANLVIETRDAHGHVERLQVLARALLESKPEVIVTFGTTAAQAAKAATPTIPIVMAFAGDPVGTRIVASLARPGGNVTGMSLAAAELSGKRLELLKEILPKLMRLTILGDTSREVEVQETEKAARTLSLAVTRVELTRVEGLDTALGEVSRTRPQAVIVLNTAVTTSRRVRIADFALKNRVPLVGTAGAWVPAGALLSYAPSLTDSARRAVAYVDKILKGAKPAELPIQQPTKFELAVNLKTARLIGLTIPPAVLARADQVIE